MLMELQVENSHKLIKIRKKTRTDGNKPNNRVNSKNNSERKQQINNLDHRKEKKPEMIEGI